MLRCCINIDCTRGHYWKLSYREKQSRPRPSRGYQWFSRGDNFQCYPLFITIFKMFIKYIVCITSGVKQSRSTEYLCLHFVFRICSNAQMTPCSQNIWWTVRAYAVDIFGNITHMHVQAYHLCQVPSRVKAWFQDRLNGWYWFSSNVSKPVRINNFTWNYNNMTTFEETEF